MSPSSPLEQTPQLLTIWQPSSLLFPPWVQGQFQKSSRSGIGKCIENIFTARVNKHYQEVLVYKEIK